MTGTILAILVGLAVGGFLNFIITILSQEEPSWGSRPGCPHCQHVLPWSEILFLFILAWPKGRCRFCGEPLSSWRYPLVVLTSSGMALALWWRFPGNDLLWVYGPFVAALVVLTVLDVQYFWLPDLITLPGTAFGLLGALIFPHPGFINALLGAALGWAFFQGVRWAYDRISRGKHQGVGGGDAKLMAFIGAVLGFQALPWVLLVSAVLGSMVGLLVTQQKGRDRFTPIPYGPFLAVGALLFLLWKK